MVDNLRCDIQSIIHQAFRLCAEVINSHFDGVLDIAYLSSNRVGLLFHQSTELAAFIGKTLDSLLDFGETYLTCCHQFRNLILGNSELLGKFLCQRNTATCKLHQVSCEQSTLHHRGTIEPCEVLQVQPQSC